MRGVTLKNLTSVLKEFPKKKKQRLAMQTITYRSVKLTVHEMAACLKFLRFDCRSTTYLNFRSLSLNSRTQLFTSMSAGRNNTWPSLTNVCWTHSSISPLGFKRKHRATKIDMICSDSSQFTALFNNTRTLKLKPQPRTAFFASVNQISGGFHEATIE